MRKNNSNAFKIKMKAIKIKNKKELIIATFLRLLKKKKLKT